jgi:nucleotide-binding universal stress UspA family protein
MFGRIVVAFDGSDHAQDALVLALRLRDRDDGRLTLACAISAVSEIPEEVALMLAAGRAHVPPGVRTALRGPSAASPARALTELAERDHADLVVIGSSRRSIDGRISLERTAGRLLQGAPCAVVVAPPGLQTEEPFHHVGIAYDGSPEARAALAAGYAIAAKCRAAVTLFYARSSAEIGDGDELLDEAAGTAPAGVNPRTLLLHGAAGEQIAAASEGSVDLLVCGSRGYGPIQRALMGSVAEELMEGALHPVLVFPRQTWAATTAADPEPAAMEA